MTRRLTRCYPPGLAGLLLLVGCGTAPAPPSPTAASPVPAAPESEAPTPATPAPPEPSVSVPSQAPSASPEAPPSPAFSVALPPVAAPVVAPPPASGGGGGGGGGGGAPPPAPGGPAIGQGLAIAEVTVDSEMAKAPKAGLADGDTATRWTSRSLKGAWAQVTLPEAGPLYAMSIQMPPQLRYDVRTSVDGRTWKGRLWGAVNASWNPEVKVFGAGVTAKFVRVSLKGAAPADKPFSILELRLHDDGPAGTLPDAPPWARPLTARTVANIEAAGVGYMEGDHTNTPQHIHAYVSIWYNGQRVEIPANLGIADGKHATMHTHDATGTIHMEGPAGQRFTLGQFFTIWGVPLTGAKVYLQGRRVADPASLQ
ncbi:MAG: discoidin domain-containing protein, partial [Candidatus Sericytochromatia bacterium]